MNAEFLSANALPIAGVIFGLANLVIFWIAGRRFDKKYGTPDDRRR